MKDFFRITVPVTCVLLVFAEIVLRFFPVEDPYKIQKLERVGKKNRYIPSQFLPNQKYTFESKEGIPHLDTLVHFSTNNYGFRGKELKNKAADCYRIFLIGGSTTECLMLDDSKAPHALMQNQLRDFQVEVYNAGKSGDMSIDHLAMLIHRVAHLEPDLIVLLCGINDLKRSHNLDYTLIDSVEFNFAKEGSFKTDLKLFLSNFQLVRRLHGLLEKRSLEAIQWKSRYYEMAGEVSKLPVKRSPPKINLKAYETNLNSFIGVCNKQGIKLLLVTHPCTWNSKIDPKIKTLHWLTSYGDSTCSEVVLDTLLAKYNTVLRHVADNPGVMLYDLANKIPKSGAYFYDDCHFNNQGAVFFTDSVSAYIRKNVLKVNADKMDSNKTGL